MLEAVMKIMQNYENGGEPFGRINLVLASDFSGYFKFRTYGADDDIRISFKNLNDAVRQWNKVFNGGKDESEE